MESSARVVGKCGTGEVGEVGHTEFQKRNQGSKKEKVMGAK